MTSAVAGILDSKGGLRVVVTQRWRMRHHVRKGEKLFIVPDTEVQEPVPWDAVPPLIEKVQKYVASTLAPINHCGECMLCCVLHYIKEEENFPEKPSNTACQHCSFGFGCKIYQSRPKACRDFKCRWLRSQSLNDQMPSELRPDRCGAYFTPDTQTNDPLIIECHGEPNADAWQWINEMQRIGYKVRKIISYVGEKKQ